jgi:predicted ATPase/DNA-binding SARP family transcriptional activator/TolA-binding protein
MLEVRALGGLTIEVDGQRRQLSARVDEALLVYLITHADPIPRDKLIDLLWQNSDPKQANNNFRSSLSRLRRVVGDYLNVTRRAVGFDFNQPHNFDAARFEAMLGPLMPLTDQPDRVDEAVMPQLAAAMELYQGDFLAGFRVRGESAEFDSWRLLLQERLHTLASSALQQLASYALYSGEWTNGIQYTAKLIRLDPLNEIAHQLKMRLHVRNRDRSAALKQYATCRQVLAEELGVEPLPATRQLAERLRNLTPYATNLPVISSPLVGRTGEIAAIVKTLLAPHTRLVTLTGIGGIGKTRVAMAVAQQLNGRLCDGVIFISLIGIEQPEGLASAVADALGIDIQLPANKKQTIDEIVANHLRERECLLVLDNYEPLLNHPAATRLVELLLQRAPDVYVLITSRESLQLYEETVIALDGLQSDATTLFIQHAARIRGTPLPDNAAEQIDRICNLLVGVPLAVELAAGQTRTQTVATIADKIEETLDGLQTTLRNLPPRQRSLRAAFDYSWRLLSKHQQLHLTQLALFVSDFDSKAAQAVGVTEGELGDLVAKSLLQSNLNNRYALHPLIREFADEKLEGERRSETVNQFCAYFAKTFVHWAKALGRNLTADALAAWRLDHANVVQAWRLAIEARDALALLRLNTPLGKFHDWRNWYRFAETLYTEAADALSDWRTADGEELEAYGDILLRQAWFIFVQGRIHEAIRRMEETEPVVRQAGDQQSIDIWRRALLQMVIKAGDYARAQTLATVLLADSDPTQNPDNHANRLYETVHIFTATGDYDRAAHLLSEAVEIFEELGDTRREQMCWYALGNLARMQGDYERAIAILRDCLAARANLDDSKHVANTQGVLADALCQVGAFDEAAQLAEAACATYEELDDRIGWPYPLNVLGNIARARGDKAEAEALLSQRRSRWRLKWIAR